MPSTMIGHTLSHYLITAKIGAGGMGEVYRAQDTRLKRDVALKVLPSEMASDPVRLERFQREAETVASLSHPNIVMLHSVEEAEGIRFLTMELVEGQSLDQLLPAGGMPLSRLFEIGGSLADALAAAHEKGIIHRDLKPANVMITKDGRVKVLDFGLAKLAEDAAPSDVTALHTEPVTKEGMVLGTVPYMSPEQLRGETVDQRSDIFSLGVLLYEMATGRRPFLGDSNSDITSAILRDTPTPLIQVKPELPVHLGRIISRCLEKDANHRFHSAIDIRNDLRGLRKETESGSVETTAEQLGAGSGAGKSPSSSMQAVVERSRMPIVFVAIAVIVVAVVAFMMSRGGDGSPETSATSVSTASPAPESQVAARTEKNSIAVLPFTDLSPDKDQEYFSDGLTEELLNVLVKIPELRVAGRTSSFSFKGKDEDLRTIGERLNVAHILQGSVRKAGNKIRISAQLVKAADGFHLWSESYDRTLDDIFAVQDDIAKSVAAELEVALLGAQGGKASRNAEAFDLVLQARYALYNSTDENIKRAKEFLDRAIEIAPGYAPAWSVLGLLYNNGIGAATTTSERIEFIRLATEALEHAYELDPTDASTLSRMSFIYRDTWQFDKMIDVAERALAIDPGNIVVLINCAQAYHCLGQSKKAVELNERAMKVDPFNLVACSNLSTSYMSIGRFDDAEKVLRRALTMDPEFFLALLNLSTLLLEKGELAESREMFDRYFAVAGLGEYDNLWYDSLHSHKAGDAATADRLLSEFEKQFGAEDPFTCASLRGYLGETDLAFKWFDKALEARDPYLAQIQSDWGLEALHDDPRWGQLLARIGFPASPTP